MLHASGCSQVNVNLLFQQDFTPLHSDKTRSNWFAVHVITGLDCPTNSPNLNHIENLEGIVRQRIKETPDPIIQMS